MEFPLAPVVMTQKFEQGVKILKETTNKYKFENSHNIIVLLK